MKKQTPKHHREHSFSASPEGIAYKKIWSTVSAIGKLPNAQTYSFSGTGLEIAQQMSTFGNDVPSPMLLGMIGRLQNRIFEHDGIVCTGLDFWQRTALSLFRQQVTVGYSETANLFAFKTYVRSGSAIRHRTGTFTGIQLTVDEGDTMKAYGLTKAPPELASAVMPEILLVQKVLTDADLEGLMRIQDIPEELDVHSLPEAVAPYIDPLTSTPDSNHPSYEKVVSLRALQEEHDFMKEQGLLTATPFEILDFNEVLRENFRLAS